jgi:hypothetical protein
MRIRHAHFTAPATRWLRRATAVAAASVLVLAASPAPARADYFSGGWPTGWSYIRPYSYNSSWQGPMDRSLNNWNATASPADIQKVSGASNYVTAASYADSWYGYYNKYCSIGCYYTVRLNARTISATATNFANYVTSVMVHEFGHALSMADNPNTTRTSIMKESRPRNSMITPQAYDVEEVNRYY